jgi:hypothetical protein
MVSTLISGFGDEKANGYYTQIGNHDGFPYYKKTTGDYIIIYRLENGPYSYSPAYWIESITITNGSVPLYGPKYVNLGTNIYTGEWLSIVDQTSGETAVGVLDELSSSSSSSSEGNSESSSSSSEGYSSSSSSSEGYSESSSSVGPSPSPSPSPS